MNFEAETKGHKKLKNTISKILQESDFDLVDTEVDIDIDEDGKTEFSIDVCALHKKTLFVFQCKDRDKITDIKKELNSTKLYIKKILEKKFNVLESDTGNISNDVLKTITDIKCCYAFTNKLSNKDTAKNVSTAKFIFWDHKAIKYYQRVSQILKGLTKNEILKEFGIKITSKTDYHEKAVEIKQENNKMYLLGIHPGLLLKIAYVYRRTGNKPDAYQRIITKDRIQSISNFFNSSKNLMLPNPVIIVFDEDTDIQENIKYEEGELHFPTSYCSAWIIDGQHRIYGFKDHPKYKDWIPDEDDDFKIPVVVFMEMSKIQQNKTFLNINYYQKRIDAILFNDLSTIIQDLSHEITWPSLLVSELNKKGPWKNYIKISELDSKKPITISGFAKTKLLSKLLGYSKKTNSYSGNLFNTSPFDPKKSFSSEYNKKAFSKQLGILIRFFTIIRNEVKDDDDEKDQWLNNKKFGLTKFTVVNALLLVLDSLLEKDPKLSMDLEKWLSCISTVDYRNDKLLIYGRGYPAMPKIANKIIKKINSEYGANLKLR
ncbi:DGQHR domain-containing protein [archaeon]|nr:DGQHR domain-containing protein [archaeon]